MSESFGAALAMKATVESFKIIVPTGIAIVSNWVRGWPLMIVGERQAGKSSFADYMQYGILLPEGPRKSSPEVEESAMFTLKMGRTQSLTLRVKALFDASGHDRPSAQARQTAERKPGAMIVVCDVSQPDVALDWLSRFAAAVSLKYEDSAYRSAPKSLKTMMVLMNKVDKYKGSVSALEGKMRDILVEGLPPLRRVQPSNMPILPTILIESQDKDRLAAAAVTRLARDLAR